MAQVGMEKRDCLLEAHQTNETAAYMSRTLRCLTELSGRVRMECTG